VHGPGMPELYRGWAGENVRFHYVSASPWQLYQPLAEFLAARKFPAGTFHMKLFRLKDRTALNLFGAQEDYKRGVIEPLLKRFPHDRFVLVGDTGEQDPKIYAGLARDYPQVSRILIRSVAGETAADYRQTFAGLAADRWQVFRDPAEVARAAP
jgi:phosphatidate phosphatase APP1